jgi:signal peptidase I
MGLDIPTVLVVITVIAGVISLADWLVPAPRGPGPRFRVIGEYARLLFPLLFVVLLIRSFVFESFRIPSESMMPGLVDGDFILVDKYSYGLRLPTLGTKIVPIGAPRRGDVVVFHSPADHSIYLIKRCVGLPGDHIVVRDNRVFVNGQEMRATPHGTYEGGYGFNGSSLEVEQFGTSRHTIMLAGDRWATDFDGTVPPKHYFFMGDNRNDSEDSRYAAVGYVPERNLVGHARWIYMHWRIPGWPDLHRVGMRIR